MFVIEAPGAAVITTTEVKKDIPGAFKEAKEHRLYVTKDGQPIGGIVSMELMQILEEVLADTPLVLMAEARMADIRSGDAKLMDADDFFARADAQMAERSR